MNPTDFTVLYNIFDIILDVLAWPIAIIVVAFILKNVKITINIHKKD